MSARTRITLAAAVAALSLVVAATPASAAVQKCQAKNVTAATKESPNLQALLDAAGSGDSIQVKGVCVGNYTIGKSVTLFGKPTKATPDPTLDGGDAGESVVRITGPGSVSISDLTITNGGGETGGGVSVDGASVSLTDVIVRDNAVPPSIEVAGGGVTLTGGGALTLSGASAISGNRAGGGGGVASDGPVTLNDTATITDNDADDAGALPGNVGGLGTPGTVTLNDSSTITNNSADGAIGGVTAGVLTLNDSSSVSSNSARQFAGGVMSFGGMITLNDETSVHENVAATAGGIFNIDGVTLNDQATVYENIANEGDLPGFPVVGGILSCSDAALTGVVEGTNVFSNWPVNLDTVLCG